MRTLPALALIALLLLVGCSGGGGYSSSGGGGGGGGGGQVIAGPGPNVATLTVQIGPAGPAFVNLSLVSVTICQPGSTTNCQTIDNVEVDTGSSGLRIMSTPSTAAFLQSLPQQLSGTTPVVECAQFADGFSWGPVVSADVVISSEKASGIPIHVIGAPAPFNADIPTDCSSPNPNEEDTVATFGANGLLGVGVFIQDCGNLCAGGVVPGTYYKCPANGAACTGIAQATSLQVSNPVASFTTDNNGVIVELPGVAASGAATATGALVFGIGTQSNNGLGSATVLTTDTSMGFGAIDARFNNTDYPGSTLDSGSNCLFFPDSALNVCPSGTAGAGFYCTPANNLMATLKGTNGLQVVAAFNVGNATNMILANPTWAAFPELAGPNTGSMDFGLPYFYGRNVFTAIEGMAAGGSTGPYFAY